MAARAFLGGTAVGAGLVYFLDPEKGGHRRERFRELAEKLAGEARRGLAFAFAANGDRPGRAVALHYGARAGDIQGLEAATLALGGESGAITPEMRALRLAGGALMLYALRRRGPIALLLRGLGAGLIARSLQAPAATPAPRRPGGERRRIVDIQKSIYIDAPVERVYAFWNNYENFPLFMSNVREVKDLGGGRSHWRVSGPGGVPIDWEAVLTQQVPNEVLAWRSVSGSMLENAGIIRFLPDGAGTRVDLRFCYLPPAGGAGRAVSELLGADPREKLNQDLGRLKALLEATVRSEQHGEEQRP